MQVFWIELIGNMVMAIYLVSIVAVTIYCLMQFHLLYYYKLNQIRRRKGDQMAPELNGSKPFVTIQLPIYNEQNVIRRLLKAVCAIQYPPHRMEIHVLDDSDDETVAIVAEEVAKYRQKGFDIHHVRRDNRKGYKAGALKEALARARGEFIALFDADFVPKQDFLAKTLPYFEEPDVGVVQTRWEHLNQDYSLLTRVQAFQLNVHFTVEQLGRKAGNLFLQFNGTAGVWRRETIDNAGGWEADTLTEDLDLSYRAQLKGWKIQYLEDIASPAELPAEINGLRSQQYRWMKGGAETAKKVLPKVWQSDLGLRTKIHGTLHLLGSSVFLAVFLLGVFSVPLLYFTNPLGIEPRYLTIFLTGLLSILIVYYVANVEVAWRDENRVRMVLKFIFLFPMFLALSMGLSFHNSLAVLQGYIGKQTPFIRTPKFGIDQFTERLETKKYFTIGLSKMALFEGLLALYFLAGMVYGWMTGADVFILMHLLLTIGYGLIFYFSIRNWKPSN